tara:strand:- start:1303 stop:1662 length:360 start_codon:yes stop_codon:yes gene_type:complete
MKKVISLILSLGIFVSISAQNTIEGTWNTGRDNTLIETYQKNGEWFGKVISSDNPKAEIGNDVLRNITESGGEWKGKLFMAKRGRLVDAIVEPSDDKLEITISGGGMKRTLTWSRKSEE